MDEDNKLEDLELSDQRHVANMLLNSDSFFFAADASNESVDLHGHLN